MKIITGEWMINYKWFLEFTLHDDNTVTINRYYRLHCAKDNFPQETERFCAEIVEDDKRTVTHLIVNFVQMEVKNPKYIFDYE